jgi:hypothetical protein
MVASIRFATDASAPVSCDTTPPYWVSIVAQGLALRGCQEWPANEQIGISFEIRDDGIPMGLELYAAASCDQSGCAGQPLWTGDVVTAPDKAYHLPPLDAGSYVLLDPVHPATARLDITVG